MRRRRQFPSLLQEYHSNRPSTNSDLAHNVSLITSHSVVAGRGVLPVQLLFAKIAHRIQHFAVEPVAPLGIRQTAFVPAPRRLRTAQPPTHRRQGMFLRAAPRAWGRGFDAREASRHHYFWKPISAWSGVTE